MNSTTKHSKYTTEKAGLGHTRASLLSVYFVVTSFRV